MAAVKSSRFGVPVPSGPVSSALQQANGGGDSGMPLVDKMKIFKTQNFDPDAYVQSKCQSMNENEIRHLCSYLQDLKKDSAEEMHKSVCANYLTFIRTSREISDLESELLSIKNLLSNQVALIHALAEGIHMGYLSASSEGSKEDDFSIAEDGDSSDMEKWAIEFYDRFDVLLAERRVGEALDALDEAECVVAEAKEHKMLRPAELLPLQTAINEHRQNLADQLAETASQSSSCGVELRAAVSALKRLGDGPRAHSLLLYTHYQRLQYNMQTIHPMSTSYGGSYTAALSQQVFSSIAQAVHDSVDTFGNDSTYASELVAWCTNQAEAFARLVKRHALGSCAAAGGLRTAAECVQIALDHCSLLEVRGLSLSSVLLKLFKPSVEQALDANLKRIEESIAALAAADDWVLTYPPFDAQTSNRAPIAAGGLQPKLSSSAHCLNSMVQEFFEAVWPLLSMQLGSSALDGLLRVFRSYISLLVNALPGSIEDDTNVEDSSNKMVRMAETESQQLALLANASLLADELLPRAAMKLSPSYQSSSMDDSHRRAPDKQNLVPEQREWKKKLHRSIDRLRDSFCRLHALDLIFTEDGNTHLTAELYLSMDGSIYEPEWTPSPIFLELFAKLNRMVSIAAEMFVGRERFATLLMMRLVETVVLWLSDDQSFWDEIEAGPTALGPLGLRQFYLDMQFIIIFGQGCYLSRHVHQVIMEIIERAMAAFATTGMDPDSVLPSDEWFIDIAQETISKITGKSRTLIADRGVSSPTASISARSMSSVRSQGSSQL